MRAGPSNRTRSRRPAPPDQTASRRYPRWRRWRRRGPAGQAQPPPQCRAPYRRNLQWPSHPECLAKIYCKLVQLSSWNVVVVAVAVAAVIFVVVAVVGVLDVVADVVGVLVVAVVFGVDVVDVDGAVVTVVGVPAGVVVMLQGGDRRGRKMDNYFLTLV